MASFARHQVIYTDGAWDRHNTKAGGCGFAFWDASIDHWDISACALGIQSAVENCELAGVLFALQHCVNINMGPEVQELEIRSDSTSIIRSIGRAREYGTLPRYRISAQLISKILLEISQLELRGVGVSISWVPGHDDIEGNEMADWAAKMSRNASRSLGADYLEWQESWLWRSQQDQDMK